MQDNKNIEDLLHTIDLKKNTKLDMKEALKNYDFSNLVKASIEYKNYFNSKEYQDLQNKIDKEFDLIFNEIKAFELVVNEIEQDRKQLKEQIITIEPETKNNDKPIEYNFDKLEKEFDNLDDLINDFDR